MTGPDLLPREQREVAPGAHHVPEWLTLAEQRGIVEQWRRWAKPPAPMRHTRLPTGAAMSVQTVCLGWHWIPYRYSRRADDVDGSPVKPFPQWLGDLGRRAVEAAYRDPLAAARYQPDVALVNYYDAGARMGMHQDRDEHHDGPIVSLSVGDTCIFRFGNSHTRNRPYSDIELRSGDLIVFGGPSRLAFHGVPKVIPGTADPGTGLSSGRLNVTLRVTGLTDAQRPGLTR